jgi:tetratricopeptide (TPR) repeat protein
MSRKRRGNKPGEGPGVAEAPTRRGRRLELVIGLALVLATVAAYAPVFQNGFVNYDDPEYLTQNREVQKGLTAGSVWWALSTTAAANWHPLTWLSLQLDYQLWGLNPTGYHLTSLLLHCASTVLLFGVLRRMTGALWASAAVAGLFALHPLHVESVAWVAERKDVLSTLFWMLTLWAYVGYVERPGPWRYLVLLLTFALGLTAKPMLVTLPFVLLLLDYWPLRRWRGSPAGDESSPAVPGVPRSLPWLVLEKLPLFALAAASCAITVIAQREGGTVETLESLPLSVRLGNALVAYVSYLGLTFFPTNLAVFYPHAREQVPVVLLLAAAALLLGISVACYRFRRRQPYLLVGWLWYLGTLVPVIGLVQVGSQALADRYTYVPLIGLFLLLAWGVPVLLVRWGVVNRAAPFALTAVVLAGCLLATWKQAQYWHDSLSLWQHALAVTDRNFITLYHLGGAFAEQGKWDRAVQHLEASVRLKPDYAGAHINLGNALGRQGKMEEARQHYAAAVQLNPENATARRNLGAALVEQGRLEEAIEQYRAALRISPDDAAIHLNLAVALSRRGKLEEALPHYEAAVAGDPNSAHAHYLFGVALARQRKWEEAREQFAAAVQIDPNHFRAHEQLGEMLGALGRLREAVGSCRRAVELQPNDVLYRASLAYALREEGQADAAAAEYRRALQLDANWPRAAGKAAWDLATHPDAGSRDGPRAVRLARQACQATGDRQPALLDALAAAYAEIGEYDRAAAVARQALSLAASAEPGRVAELESRVHLYESRQPYRDPSAGSLGRGPRGT